MINILTRVSPTLGYRLAPVSPGLSVVMLHHQNMVQKLPQEAVLSPRGIGCIEPKWCLSMRWNGIHIISRNYIWWVDLPERQDPGDHWKEIQVWIQIPGRGLQERADTDVTLDFDEAEELKPYHDSVARDSELAWGQMENHARMLNKNLKPLMGNSIPESVVLWIPWPGTF